jgi:hypothetical protein
MRTLRVRPSGYYLPHSPKAALPLKNSGEKAKDTKK